MSDEDKKTFNSLKERVSNQIATSFVEIAKKTIPKNEGQAENIARFIANSIAYNKDIMALTDAEERHKLDSLSQMIYDLEKNPDNTELLEEILRLLESFYIEKKKSLHLPPYLLDMHRLFDTRENFSKKTEGEIVLKGDTFTFSRIQEGNQHITTITNGELVFRVSELRDADQ